MDAKCQIIGDIIDNNNIVLCNDGSMIFRTYAHISYLL